MRDLPLARDLLARAEEQVTTVGEMKNLVAAVKAHFAEDGVWVAQVDEKLTRREANQAKYAVFQEREKGANTAIKTLQLADAVMAELDDKFYAQKLLVDAQKKLEEEGWDFSKARKLVAGVSRHLGDSAWAGRLLQDAGERVQGFTNLMVVAESAAELLPDREQAQALVTDLLERYQQGLSVPGVYDLSKLADARGRLLGDRKGAGAALTSAASQAATHFQFAELARVARGLDLGDQVQNLLERAAVSCTSAAQARQLARRLLADGFDQAQVRDLYAGLKDRLSVTPERLAWADAIVDLFADRTWAGQELGALAGAAQGVEARAIASQARRRSAHL